LRLIKQVKSPKLKIFQLNSFNPEKCSKYYQALGFMNVGAHSLVHNDLNNTLLIPFSDSIVSSTHATTTHTQSRKVCEREDDAAEKRGAASCPGSDASLSSSAVLLSKLASANPRSLRLLSENYARRL